jgi:hypothetical protein
VEVCPLSAAGPALLLDVAMSSTINLKCRPRWAEMRK